MIDNAITMRTAVDDDYWAVPVDEPGLRSLIQGRRAWVSANAEVLDEHQRPIPAELAEHFSMLFVENSDPFGRASYIVEGIHKTGLVFVRTQPYALALARNTMRRVAPYTIDVFCRRTSKPNGPWLFSSHIQLGDQVNVITDFLLRARTNPIAFLADLNDPSNTFKTCDVDDTTGAITCTAYSSCQYRLSHNWIREVAYYGNQPDPATIDDPIPPACNPIFGTATVDPTTNTLYLTIESVVVKAYP